MVEKENNMLNADDDDLSNILNSNYLGNQNMRNP